MSESKVKNETETEVKLRVDTGAKAVNKVKNRTRTRARRSFLRGFCIALAFVFVAIPAFSAFAQGARGKVVPVKVTKTDGSVVETPLYTASRALLIGVSDYTAGWPDLESIPSELDMVEGLLTSQGFTVEKHMDPDARQLKRIFEDFIAKYGYDPEARLLFFFSGHGHTRMNGAKGYLVPADAPNPNKDETGFLQKALSMNQIIAWSRIMEAKHALFLFDSCFSGTVFKAKALPKTPPLITELTTKPVRQFITAGGAGETVPAQSVFTPALVDALRYGTGDLNKDGYVSGTELGLYLQDIVPKYSRQFPQYGKIVDYSLSRGDFVFALASGDAASGSASANLPKNTKASLDEFLKESEAKRMETEKWEHWQKARDSDYEKILKIDEDPYLTKERKKEAWRIFLASVDQDNPHSTKDDQMREYSKSRFQYWENYRDEPQKARLYVKTTPENARVRILNIGPRFHQGMELAPGRYHVETSADGYETDKEWISLGEGEEKTLAKKLEKSEKTITLFGESPSQQHASLDPVTTRAKIVERDRHFAKYDTGVVRDTRTGLEWYAGPDKNTDWHEANRWASNLGVDGGGWRMPTRSELAKLYEKGIGSRNMTPLLETSGWIIWSSEKKGSSAAWNYYFYLGEVDWHGLDFGNSLTRGFAVRSR